MKITGRYIRAEMSASILHHRIRGSASWITTSILRRNDLVFLRMAFNLDYVPKDANLQIRPNCCHYLDTGRRRLPFFGMHSEYKGP